MLHLFIYAVYVLLAVASLTCVALLRRPLRALAEIFPDEGGGAPSSYYGGAILFFALLLLALYASTASSWLVG